MPQSPSCKNKQLSGSLLEERHEADHMRVPTYQRNYGHHYHIPPKWHVWATFTFIFTPCQVLIHTVSSHCFPIYSDCPISMWHQTGWKQIISTFQDLQSAFTWCCSCGGSSLNFNQSSLASSAFFPLFFSCSSKWCWGLFVAQDSSYPEHFFLNFNCSIVSVKNTYTTGLNIDWWDMVTAVERKRKIIMADWTMILL